MTSTSDQENMLLEASNKMRLEAVQFRAKFDVFIDQLNAVIEESADPHDTKSTE